MQKEDRHGSEESEGDSGLRSLPGPQGHASREGTTDMTTGLVSATVYQCDGPSCKVEYISREDGLLPEKWMVMARVEKVGEDFGDIHFHSRECLHTWLDRLIVHQATMPDGIYTLEMVELQHKIGPSLL